MVSKLNLTAVVALCAFIAGACSSPDRDSYPGFLQLEQSKSNSRLLAQFYLGGLSDPPANPESSGILADSNRALLIHIDRLSAVDPEIASQLQSAAPDNRLSWDDFERVMTASYYDKRSIPNSINDLVESYWSSDSTMFEMHVDGVMSVATRRVMVPVDIVRDAVATFGDNGRQIIYNNRTLFLAEHLIDDEIVEYTAMIKRSDGFWDFAAYDASGILIDSTVTEPKHLAVPTQCTGCHFGSRLFEPEKSFPAAAPAGPDGVRQVVVKGTAPPPNLVGALDEHRKRSDYILGLYGTVYLHQQTRDGTAADSMMGAVLRSLELR